jgi:nucleotide-binding universal stress UspA family protein
MGRWVLGSVAEKVLHGAPRPLLLVRASAPAAASAEVSYRKVAVPLDGSRFAEQALSQAQAIASAAGAELLLIAVVPVLDDVDFDDAGVAPASADAERQAEVKRVSRYLAGMAAQLEAEGFRVRPRVVAGMPAEEILHVSAAEGADLLVMATHGHTGLQRFWLGSTATKVVRSADLPVLLVRAEERPANEKQR